MQCFVCFHVGERHGQVSPGNERVPVQWRLPYKFLEVHERIRPDERLALLGDDGWNGGDVVSRLFDINIDNASANFESFDDLEDAGAAWALTRYVDCRHSNTGEKLTRHSPRF